LNGDSLAARALAQDFVRNTPSLAEIKAPATSDPLVFAMSAALLELFASRAKQEAPAWTRVVGAVSEPIFLLKSAQTMKHLRVLCETESSEPLRKRGFYASPNYLEFA
jgi:hypothetical protein